MFESSLEHQTLRIFTPVTQRIGIRINVIPVTTFVIPAKAGIQMRSKYHDGLHYSAIPAKAGIHIVVTKYVIPRKQKSTDSALRTRP